jgi:hypothetical protein
MANFTFFEKVCVEDYALSFTCELIEFLDFHSIKFRFNFNHLYLLFFSCLFTFFNYWNFIFFLWLNALLKYFHFFFNDLELFMSLIQKDKLLSDQASVVLISQEIGISWSHTL